MKKHCHKCNVEVDIHHNTCPLCGAYLESVEKLTDEEEYKQIDYSYPKLNNDVVMKMLLQKITILITIISILACAMINYLSNINSELTWVWHVIVGWIIFWVTIGRTLFFHLEFKKQIVWDSIFASLLAFYIQFSILGRFQLLAEENWALVWATPSFLLGAMGGLAIHAIIRYKEWARFALPMTAVNIISIVPLITYYILYKEVHFMTFIAAGVGIFTLISMMIVGRKKYFTEYMKKFHM